MSPLADKGKKITIPLMTPCWGCITCYCDGLVEINAINRNDMRILIYGSWFSNWQITCKLDLLTYLMNSENKVASDWIFQRQLGVFDVRKLTPWRLFLQCKHCRLGGKKVTQWCCFEISFLAAIKLFLWYLFHDIGFTLIYDFD